MLEHGLAAGVQLQLVDQLTQKLLALPHTRLLRLTAMLFDHGDRVLSAQQILVLTVQRIIVIYRSLKQLRRTVFLDNPQIAHDLFLLRVFQKGTSLRMKG